MAATDVALSDAIAEAVYAVNPELVLFGLSGSELIRSGKKIGLRVASEVFSDRTYQADGTLTNRQEKHALILHTDKAIQQVIGMVKEGIVTCKDGTEVSFQADTVCIHGDGVHALDFARRIYETLKHSEIEVRKILNTY